MLTIVFWNRRLPLRAFSASTLDPASLGVARLLHFAPLALEHRVAAASFFICRSAIKLACQH